MKMPVLLFLLLCLGVSGVQAASFQQWATNAEASSQYRNDRWSASQATGPPDTYPRHGDFDTAWTTGSRDSGFEWLLLTYAEAVVVDEVSVYETCNPGAIVKVELVDQAGASHEIWRGVGEPAPKEARIFTVANKAVGVAVNKVRLLLDTSRVPGWNEIDAVGITGRRIVDQFADMSVLNELDAVLARLEESIERAKAARSAHPAFLQDLEACLADLLATRDVLQREMGVSQSQWGNY